MSNSPSSYPSQLRLPINYMSPQGKAERKKEDYIQAMNNFMAKAQEEAKKGNIGDAFEFQRKAELESEQAGLIAAPSLSNSLQSKMFSLAATNWTLNLSTTRDTDEVIGIRESIANWARKGQSLKALEATSDVLEITTKRSTKKHLLLWTIPRELRDEIYRHIFRYNGFNQIVRQIRGVKMAEVDRVTYRL
jgi:hypothetical protein